MQRQPLLGCCRYFAFLILLANFSAHALEQFSLEIPFPGEATRALYKWDAVQRELILYRDVKDMALPALRAYDSGFAARAPIYPLKDFPGAIGVDVWGVAAAPGGMTVLAAVVQYGGLNNKSLVLTYDGTGSLRKLWDVRPYHHHQIAVDREGNVYGFGHREDRGEGADEPDYPLLIKYSPNGNVLWESLPRSAFPYDMEIVVTNGESLEHSLAVAGDTVVLYVSTRRELRRFSAKDGSLGQRVSLSSILDRIALGEGLATAKILCLGVASSSDLIVQLRLEPRNTNRSPALLMARISGDGSSYSKLGSTASTPTMGVFVGLDALGRCVFLKSRTHEYDPLIVEVRDLSQ